MLTRPPHRRETAKNARPHLCFAALHESPPGTKRTCRGKVADVRFEGQSGRGLSDGVRSASDPDVWSGRALQEDFVELADVRSCINVSGL
jgi:hypothetical protein